MDSNTITPLIQQYTVDFASNNNFLFVKGIQGDGYATRYVDISLVNNGYPYEIDVAAVTVVIRGTKPESAFKLGESVLNLMDEIIYTWDDFCSSYK